MSLKPVTELVDLENKEHKDLEALMLDLYRAGMKFEEGQNKIRNTSKLVKYRLTPQDYELLKENEQLRNKIESGKTPVIGGSYEIIEDRSAEISRIEYTVLPKGPKKADYFKKIVRRTREGPDYGGHSYYDKRVIGTPRGDMPVFY